AIYLPKIQAIQHANEYELKLSGVFNFMNQLKIKAAAKKIPRQEKAVINFEEAILIDFSIMEYLGNFGKKHKSQGGSWKMKGLDNHESTSSHPYSMRMLQPAHQHSPRW